MLFEAPRSGARLINRSEAIVEFNAFDGVGLEFFASFLGNAKKKGRKQFKLAEK